MADRSHFVVVVAFASELLGVGVVTEGGYGGVGDHDGFEVEAAIS